jgi:agmatinase
VTKKLDELAKRDPFDLRHREALRYFAEDLQRGGAATQPPYAEIPTLLSAPYQPELAEADIALLGVPFDLGVTNRAGARHGPREVRSVSAMAAGPMHHQSKLVPFNLCRVVDGGDVRFASHYGLDRAIEEIAARYREIVEAGVTPLSVGGDHSITFPILEAVGAREPVGLVHIDAHCDTMGPLHEGKFHHGGPFRNAALAGVLDPERTVQIGIRGLAEPFWDFSYDSGMRVIHIEEFREMGVEAVVEEARRVVGDGPTYISFDVDGLDPAFAPGTGTPVVGGLTPLEAQLVLRGLRGLNLVGGDVVEVAPPFDPAGITALVGATMLFEILCVVAESVATRRPASGRATAGPRDAG